MEYQKFYEINPFEDIQEGDDRFEPVINSTNAIKIHRILIDELGNEKFYTLKLNFVKAEVIPFVEDVVSPVEEALSNIEDDNWVNYFFGNPYKIIYTVTGAVTVLFLSYRALKICSAVFHVLDYASEVQDIKEKLDSAEKYHSYLSNLKITKKNAQEIIKEVAKDSKVYMKNTINLQKMNLGAEKSFVISTQKKFLKDIKINIALLNKQYVDANNVFEDNVKNLLEEVQTEVLYVIGGIIGVAASTVAYKLLGEFADLE